MLLTERLKSDSGYGWIMTQLAPLTPFGRAMARTPRWYAPEERDELELELANLEQALGLMVAGNSALASLNVAFQAFRDPRNSLNRPEDAPMDEVELFEIKYFLLTLDNLVNRYSALASFRGIDFQTQDELLCLLDPSGRRLPAFSIEDGYSPELAQVRKDKAALEEQLRAAVGQEREPLLNQRRLLALREDELELAVRRELTARVLAEKPVLMANMDAVGRLDFLLAKARLARRFGSVRPVICDGQVITGVDMIHPEVSAVLAEHNRSFTPISLTLGQGATVITGANMGGKSVALKTTTLNQLLLQTGFFVFAASYSAPLFHSVTLLLADNQSVERGLSSFGAEVTVLNDLLQETRGRFFFLALDEFARGTNPREGAALARALAEYLCKLSCIALMTTHYDGVSEAAASHYQVTGLRDLPPEDCPPDENPLARLARMMDYRLIPAPPGVPCPRDALRVCRLLDLEPELLEIFSQNG